MGTEGYTPYQRRAALKEQRERDAVRTKLRNDARQELAAKITMALVDRVVSTIIRPGPKPEERECYVMAEELRTLSPELETLARQVIDVHEDDPVTQDKRADA